MVHSPWKLFVLDRHTPGEQRSRRRRQMVLRVECVALDRRQLLSNVVPAASEFSVPPAGVVANAAAILESKAPRAFAQYQAALVQAEQQSHVNPADAVALAQDEAVVDQDLEAAGASGLNDVQDWVDNAFTYGSAGIRDVPAGTWFLFRRFPRELIKVSKVPRQFSMHRAPLDRSRRLINWSTRSRLSPNWQGSRLQFSLP